MRGEFRRADGLVIPNNVSLAGAQMILAAALRGDVPTLFVALVKGVPTPGMTEADMDEPTIGTHGYGRIGIPCNHAGWPTQGVVGVERYIMSQVLTFAASGGNFDKTVQRLALMSSATRTGGNPVYALSMPFPTEETITPTTILGNRQFQYSLFI